MAFEIQLNHCCACGGECTHAKEIKQLCTLHMKIKQLQEDKRIAIGALEFYADEHSWQGLIHRSVGKWEGWDGTMVANDGGERAREALDKVRKEG